MFVSNIFSVSFFLSLFPLCVSPVNDSWKSLSSLLPSFLTPCSPLFTRSSHSLHTWRRRVVSSCRDPIHMISKDLSLTTSFSLCLQELVNQSIGSCFSLCVCLWFIIIGKKTFFDSSTRSAKKTVIVLELFLLYLSFSGQIVEKNVASSHRLREHKSLSLGTIFKRFTSTACLPVCLWNRERRRWGKEKRHRCITHSAEFRKMRHRRMWWEKKGFLRIQETWKQASERMTSFCCCKCSFFTPERESRSTRIRSLNPE